MVDCKTVGFFLKISKEVGKAWRKSNTRESHTPFPASFQTFCVHEEPRKVPFLIILSDGCYTQFPVRLLPPTLCMLAGVRLAVIGSDLHRGDETILNFATVC